MNYDEFLNYLSKEAVDHIAYYHYTQWESFRKMMTPADAGPAKGHRMLVLSNVTKTNDGLEENWPMSYYIACFSLSRYEDVAMWLNYGKKGVDAVRVKFTETALDKIKIMWQSLG